MIQVIKSAFRVDDEPIYLGYTNGARWNGWATPFFTKEQFERICIEHLTPFQYFPEIDTFYYINGEHNIDTPNTLEGWNEIVYQCYAEQISGCLLTCEQKTFRGYQFNGYVWRELHKLH